MLLSKRSITTSVRICTSTFSTVRTGGEILPTVFIKRRVLNTKTTTVAFIETSLRRLCASCFQDKSFSSSTTTTTTRSRSRRSSSSRRSFGSTKANMENSRTNITVVGAGVVGLTNAMVLSRNPNYKVTVIAKHMPGDYDIEYASPWAGANYLPFGAEGSSDAEYERATWAELERLTREVSEAGIHFQDVLLYNRSSDAAEGVTRHLMSESPWYRSVVPNWRTLQHDELPANVTSGTTFTSVCINTAIYLPWLASQCLRQGVVFHRGIIKHITDPAKSPNTSSFYTIKPEPASIVVNCTGLASKFLPGVADARMYPLRGQIVVVRNSPVGNMYTVEGDSPNDPEEFTYAMERAAGGGTVLGGCAQRDKWDSQPDQNLALRIMQRCIDACPSLVPEGAGVSGMSVIRHGVGLRPAREGGIRVEHEQIDGVPVVHCYGHGGYGYQTSYGTVAKAVQFVDAIVGKQ